MSFYDNSSNDLFIPGMETWRFEGDIDAEININTDEEADEAESEALADSVSNEQEGSSIESEDNTVTEQMIAGFRGYEALFRAQEFLTDGPANMSMSMREQTVMHFFDPNLYIQNYVPGQESLVSSIKSAASGVGNFLARIWEKIVELFQRMLPWLGQSLKTLETRSKALRVKLSSLDAKAANANLKASKSTRKVVMDNTWFKLVNGIFTLGQRTRSLAKSKLPQNKQASDHTVSSIKSLLDQVDKGLEELKQMESKAVKGKAAAEKNLRDAEKITADVKELRKARDEANEAKRECTDILTAIRTSCKWFTTVLNDIKFLINVAA